MNADALALEADVATPVRAARDGVDVWQVSLRTGASESALRTLDDSERAYAARLRVGAARWVAARAALRVLLGRYLGCPAAEVALESGACGKPRLAPGGPLDLRFNLSHSGDVALIAVRLGSEVGIDIEEMRPGVDGAAIAREVFSASERAALQPPGASGVNAEFFRAWARREALAKATGRGIAAPASPGDHGAHAVVDLTVGADFAAALASEGADWTVRWHIS